MRGRYLCQDGDTGFYSILVPLGTKDETLALERGDELVNDLLNTCTFTKREYDRVTKTNNPNFRRSIERIEKRLWRLLK